MKNYRRASRRLESLTPEQRFRELLGLVTPMLEFFADIDDVFSEDDALSAEKRQMGLGRCYRAWKRCRTAMDPDYDPERDQRERLAR